MYAKTTYPPQIDSPSAAPSSGRGLLTASLIPPILVAVVLAAGVAGRPAAPTPTDRCPPTVASDYAIALPENRALRERVTPSYALVLRHGLLGIRNARHRRALARTAAERYSIEEEYETRVQDYNALAEAASPAASTGHGLPHHIGVGDG